MAGPLGALIVRRPGAALGAELLAALFESLVSVSWSGTSIVVYGVVEGAAAEAAFALARYRDWSLRVGVALRLPGRRRDGRARRLDLPLLRVLPAGPEAGLPGAGRRGRCGDRGRGVLVPRARPGRDGRPGSVRVGTRAESSCDADRSGWRPARVRRATAGAGAHAGRRALGGGRARPAHRAGRAGAAARRVRLGQVDRCWPGWPVCCTARRAARRAARCRWTAGPRTPTRHRSGLVLQDPETQIVMSRAGDDVAFGPENYGVPADQIWPRVARGVGHGRVSLRPLALRPQRCPVARSSGWPWPASWPIGPGCCCWTSPRPTSTRTAPGSSGTPSTAPSELTGATLVVVEHRVEPWLPLVDRVVVLAAGDGLLADGPPERVFGGVGATVAGGRDLVAGVVAVAGFAVAGVASAGDLAASHRGRGSGPTNGALIEARGLRLRYPRAAVDAVVDADLRPTGGPGERGRRPERFGQVEPGPDGRGPARSVRGSRRGRGPTGPAAAPASPGLPGPGRRNGLPEPGAPVPDLDRARRVAAGAAAAGLDFARGPTSGRRNCSSGSG